MSINTTEISQGRSSTSRKNNKKNS